MLRALSIIVAVLAGLAVSGCASSLTSSAKLPSTTKDAAVALPSSGATPPNPQDIQNVLAQLQQSEPIDQATNDRLAADLRQSDPAIWPLVIEQFRATQAYRRQAMIRNGTPEYARRLPAASGEPPMEPPRERYPDASVSPSGEVAPASYSTPSTSNWQQRLNDAIEALEAETPVNPTTPVELAQHARLRMLYAAAGRREDAARPIPDTSLATQQFLSKELEGLGAWLDAEQVPDAARRAIEAKPALTEALTKLGETAPLFIRNAAFCTEVLSFARVKRLDKNEFVADQELLLYAELENFVSEPTANGFRTSVRSAYEILDSLGRQVARREFAPSEECCKSVRHDFFMSYRIRLPRQIVPGKYLLRLVIQDAVSQKIGQASLEFVVKEGKADKEKKSPIGSVA